MAKTGYRFNPETLSYDRIHVSVKKKLWSLVVKFFSSLSLALVIFLIVSAIVDSPKEKALKREKEEILAQYHILNNELERMDEGLKNLETRDDNIYRVIFESEPIDASIRRAGSGGVNRYESLKDMDNAELIINTSKKLDELSKALYIQSKSYDEIETLAKNKIEMLASIPAILPVSLKTPCRDGFFRSRRYADLCNGKRKSRICRNSSRLWKMRIDRPRLQLSNPLRSYERLQC